MSAAAFRAAARIAWRQGRRAPARSALVIATVALPIAALVLGVTLIRTSVSTPDEYVAGRIGSAELELHPSEEIDRRSLRRALPRGSTVVAIRQWNRTLVVDGSLVHASVFEPSVPIDQPPIPGLYALLEGRAPRRAGEAAIDPRIEEIFGTGIGDTLEIAERSFRVVGVAARPAQMWEPLVVVAPGSFDDGSESGETFLHSYLVDLPESADVAEAERGVARWVQRGSASRAGEHLAIGISESLLTREEIRAQFINDAPALTGISFAGTVVLLFATGLIAAAAFAVGTRRQLRALGLIGATGGDASHVRAVVLLGGASLGLAGALLGLAVGLAGAYGVTPSLHRLTHAMPGPVTLHWPTLAGGVVLGVLAALAAAAWPARIATRISTLDALASRMPAPRPAGRLAGKGLAAVVVGAAVTAVVARPGGNQGLLAAGLVVMLGGFLVAVPLLVQIAGRLGPMLPTMPRLGVRETARHSIRTGTAVAAAAVALTLPVAVAASSLSEEAYWLRQGVVGEHHLLIGSLGGDLARRDGTVAPPRALLDEIERLLPGAVAATHRIALIDTGRHPAPDDLPPPVAEEWTAYVEGPLVTRREPGGATTTYHQGGQLFIGSADLLRALGAEDGIAALESGKVVGIGARSTKDGTVHLETTSRVPLPAVEAGSTRYSSDGPLPRYVISQDGAKAIGVRPGPLAEHTIVAARAPLSAEQVRAVKDAAARYPDVYVKAAEDFTPRLRRVRLVASAAAVLVALAIVAVVVGLVGAESRRDHAILVAVGAAPGAQRRIAGARAGLVAFLAGLVALPGGLLPVALLMSADATPYPFVVPWMTIAVVTIGVPALAALLAAATSRAPAGGALVQPSH